MRSPRAKALAMTKEDVWGSSVHKKSAVISNVLVLLLVSSRAFAFTPDPDYLFVTNQSASSVIGHECLTVGAANDNNAKSKSLVDVQDVFYSTATDQLFVADGVNHRVLIYNNANSLAAADGSADIVIGQPDLCSNKTNQGASKPAANTLNGPTSVAVFNGKLVISDVNNNRVLIFNSIPTSHNASADVVIGQPHLSTGAANQSGTEAIVSSNTLNSPYGLHIDSSGKLYIADQGNHRVLIYSSIPTISNKPADVVIGQANFTSKQANRGGAVSASTLNSPRDALVVGTKLLVSDASNHRVLIYDPIPTSTGAAASLVIGQANLTSGNADQGVSVDSKTLDAPWGLASDGTKLVIVEEVNNRALVYNAIPSTHNVAANFVIGQANFTSSNANQGTFVGSTTVNFPSGASVDSVNGKLYIADQTNARVLVFNAIPSANNTGADKVIGQPSLTISALNQVGPNPRTLSTPRGLYSDGTKLYLADAANHRVVIYNGLTNFATGSIFLGQVNSTNTSANRGGSANAGTLSLPWSVFISSDKIFVADGNNHRVLIYPSSTSTSGSNATWVVGQPNFTTTSAENAGDANDDLLKFDTPTAVFSDGTKLWVADRNNKRIMVFNPIPGPGVSVSTSVIGTKDVFAPGGASSFEMPVSVFGVGNKLFIVDQGSNHRVLILTNESGNSIPDGTVAVSTVVVGQSGFGVTGSGTAANKLSTPASAWSDGTKLWIADSGNGRVLQFSTIPSTNGVSADIVFGQRDFTGGSANANTAENHEAEAYSLKSPSFVFGVSGTKLFVSESGNHRVLSFTDLNGLTPSSNASNFAGTALGVSSMTWSWTPLTNAWHQVVASTGGAVSSVLVANTTFYTEVGLSTNTAFSRAVAVSFNSNFSNASTATAVSRYTSATNVINLTTEKVTSNSVKFNWNTNTNPDGTRYVVQLSSRAAFLPVEISTPIAYADALTASTTTISGLMPGTTVALRVMAYNGDAVAASTFSNVVQATLLMPSGFSTNVSSATISTTTFAGGAGSFLGADQATTLIISQGTALPNSAAGGTVSISTNPLITPLAVSTTAIAAALDDASSSGQTALADSVREFVFFDPFGKSQTGNFSQNITLRIPYPDANQDGFVDTDTKIPEKKLKIFKLNENLQKWEEVGGTVVEASNYVSVNVLSLSVYALLAGAATSNLDNVIVYPTPWQKGAGGQFDAPNLIFDNLTAQAKIQVFTILGELVWEKETSSSGGSVFWDGKNMKGENVASGVYLWRATNNSGQSKQGRLAIER